MKPLRELPDMDPVIGKVRYYFPGRTCLLVLLSAQLLLCSFCTGKKGTTGIQYYLSSSGDDTNPGINAEQAWKTIDKLNNTDLNPGDQILFEGGTRFHGTLYLNSGDSGTPLAGVKIGSFGNGMAIIDGGRGCAIRADSCNYLSVSGIILEGSGRKEGNTEDGLFITGSKSVTVDSVEVYGFQHSGVHFEKCRDGHITNVYAHDNGFAGIHVTGNTMWDSTSYDNFNIYIAYCKAENNPGDPSVTENHSGSGIIASSVDSGIIEYCEALNNGWDMPWNGNGPVGIWIWDCRNFTIQYCISHDNKTSKGAADGGGFDFDGGVSNSVLQYCVSYNNHGPGIGLFEFGAAKVWENNIVRYNISQDDGITGMASLSIWKGEAGGVIRNCEIYNNVLFNSNPGGASLCIMNNWPGFNFRNNIFIYNGPFLMKGNRIDTEIFQRNCYWNLGGGIQFLGYSSLESWSKQTGKEILDGKFIGLFLNPDFKFPGKITLTDPRKLNPTHFKEYHLKTGSALIDSGLRLEDFDLDPGVSDLLKNRIPQGKGYDIGAIEWIGKQAL